MMLIERSTRVAVPIETVWEVVERAEHLPAWLAGVRQAEVVSGAGFGRRQRVRAADGGALDAEVIAYQRPTLIAWRERVEGAGARAEARTEIYVELAAEGAETAVRLIMVRWPDSRVSGALLRWGMRRVGADLEGSLARLTGLATVGHPGFNLLDSAQRAEVEQGRSVAGRVTAELGRIVVEPGRGVVDPDRGAGRAAASNRAATERGRAVVDSGRAVVDPGLAVVG